jgi:RNA polymerase sigma factor (sigma-70 family)
MARDRTAVPLDRLERAAAKLRPIEREVLVLGAREGLSNGEIAARLGITPESAERLLARALCRLDRALERRRRPWWRCL